MLTALVRYQYAFALRGLWSPELRRLGYLGVLNPGISYALSLAGLAYLTASLSVLLWAIEPVLSSGSPGYSSVNTSIVA